MTEAVSSEDQSDEMLPQTRSDRREKIKLIIEYIELAISLSAIVAVAFAAVQWRDSNKITEEKIYQKMTTEWRSH
jgi:hypothetical protein